MLQSSWRPVGKVLAIRLKNLLAVLYILYRVEARKAFALRVLCSTGAAYMMLGKRFTKSNYHAADFTEIWICNSLVRQVLVGI